ncbi:MAG: hypothetical protein PUC65_16065 [Clostridiales bacterium]|nr:hypothetical protein [Clostridiales bacterium]
MSMKSKYKSGYKRHSVHRSSRTILLILCIVIFCGVIGSGLYLIFNIKSKDAQTSEGDLIKIYVAKEEIARGNRITTSKVEEIQVHPEMDVNYYSNSSCMEQIAAVDIAPGMPILSNMICSPDVEEGQREVECEILTLSDNLVDNDYVDVRIMMPNGEDYIVLAKKSVHDLTRSEDNQDEKCYLWMSEDEILYYSAAIVDAYLYPGSSIYTTKYIEPLIQEPSITTYVPSIGTMTMMKQNPNLLKEAIGHLKEKNRKQLENRLTNYLNKDIREDLWSETETSIEDTVINPSNEEDEGAISVIKDDGQTEDIKDKQEALSVFVDDSKVKGALGE